VRPARQSAIDALRGLVMIIMALDHVRDFFHQGAQSFSPEDLSKTTTAIFLTRWITHFCAPVFMLTAGIGAWLWSRHSTATPQALSVFLLKRGLWLALLDFTVMRFGMNLTLQIPVVILNVLWALGWSMVVLAALAHLPPKILAVVCIAVISLHNLSDGVRDGVLWTFLHRPGSFMAGEYTVIVAYQIIPWFAVMALGFSMGPLFHMDSKWRQRFLLRAGLLATAGFLLLRTVNIYGDPFRRGPTLLSFLRTTKYPPSLEFLLMTLGPSLLLLVWLERHPRTQIRPLLVFGRVPLFYFVGHFFLAHLLAFVLAEVRYGYGAFALNPAPSMGAPRELFPPGYGYSLPQTYLIWIAVVLMMYPLCIWYSRYKQAHSYWWLRYL
jgi:uncharacterized membrane protein